MQSSPGDTTAAIFLLKAYKPQVYSDSVRHLNADGTGDPQVNVNVKRDLRHELLRDPKYLDYLEYRERLASESAGGDQPDIDTRFVRADGERGQVGNGAASQGAGQGANGDHPE